MKPNFINTFGLTKKLKNRFKNIDLKKINCLFKSIQLYIINAENNEKKSLLTYFTFNSTLKKKNGKKQH
jgi:hypothetical protein